MERAERLWPGGPRYIYDEQCFPPSTDSFLLGSFAAPRRDERVCDLGAGAGLLGLLLLGSVLYNALWEPEYLTGMVMTANGIEMGEAQPNPNYISGALRTVFQFLVDTLPTGQSILLANQELGRPGLSLAASGAIVLLCSGCGVATFRRKDLK